MGVGCRGPDVSRRSDRRVSRESDYLVLSPGDTLVINRVRRLEFGETSTSALQLEYEAPFSVSDTAADVRMATRVWPFLLPYLNAQSLRTAVITAVNSHSLSSPSFGSSVGVSASFGLVAERRTGGDWYLIHIDLPLPPGDTDASPAIFQATGVPLPLVPPDPFRE